MYDSVTPCLKIHARWSFPQAGSPRLRDERNDNTVFTDFDEIKFTVAKGWEGLVTKIVLRMEREALTEALRRRANESESGDLCIARGGNENREQNES